MEGVGNIKEIACNMVNAAGTSSKSSTLDKVIEKYKQSLLADGLKYQEVRDSICLIRKAIKVIHNPGHDLTQKQSKLTASYGVREINDSEPKIHIEHISDD